jgi:hypothetical protein
MVSVKGIFLEIWKVGPVKKNLDTIKSCHLEFKTAIQI